MEEKNTNIPSPEFQQYERVHMDWNGKRTTKIVSRWYEIDKDQWWYKVQNDETFYPGGAFCHVVESEDLLQ